jgi:hypothetical protein
MAISFISRMSVYRWLSLWVYCKKWNRRSQKPVLSHPTATAATEGGDVRQNKHCHDDDEHDWR